MGVCLDVCSGEWSPLPALLSRSEYKVKYLRSGPDRIGRRYRKAVFTQYTDGNFTVRAEHKQRKMETGVLGPVIRAQIRDVVKVGILP